MKVLLKAAFNQFSGYGQDGIGLASALSSLGHTVHLLPTTLTPPVQEDVAALLRHDYEIPYDVTIVHLDPFQLEVGKSIRAASNRVVGWTMWEYEEIRAGKRKDRRRIKNNIAREFDGVVVYDSVSQKAMAPYAPDAHVLQGGYAPEPWSDQLAPKDWYAGTIKFVMVGDLVNKRKGVAYALTAFNNLRNNLGYDAELLLKVNGRDDKFTEWAEAVPGVEVIDRLWSHERMVKLYQDSHCLLAPSMGEGKNLPALEAQSTGLPVIATAYGGHNGWLNAAYAYRLDYQVKKTKDGPCAHPDVQHLTYLMEYAATHRDDLRTKGIIASSLVPQMMNWKVKAHEFMHYVESIPPRDLATAL